MNVRQMLLFILHPSAFILPTQCVFVSWLT